MKKLTKAQRDRLDSIPPSGEWWRSATRDHYRKAFARLLDLGMPDEEAADFLYELFHVTGGEYGA